MKINDDKFWTVGTRTLAQAIEILAGEVQVNCEKIEMTAGDEVKCYLDAIDNDLHIIEELRLRLYYFSDVAMEEQND